MVKSFGFTWGSNPDPPKGEPSTLPLDRALMHKMEEASTEINSVGLFPTQLQLCIFVTNDAKSTNM